MHRLILKVAVLLVCCSLITSCTTLLPYQNVKLKGGDGDATYFMNSSQVEIGNSRLVRKKMPFVVTGQKYGCITKSDVVKPKRIDGMLLMSALFYPIFPFEFLLPGGPKKHAHNTMGFELDTIAVANLRDIYIGSAATLDEVQLENVNSIVYKKFKHFNKSRHTLFARDRMNNGISYQNETWFEMESKVDEILEVMKCKNDLGGLISRYDKFISLSVRVKEGESTFITQGSMKKFDLKLEWYLNDKFNHPVDSMEVIATSQWMYAGYDYLSGSSNSYAADYSAMHTLIEDAMVKLVHNPDFSLKVRDVKNKMDKEFNNQTEIVIDTPMSSVHSLDDAIQTQVTIEIDDYHGSGCVISSTGHILTSYKIIQDADSISVLMMDGAKYKAEVLRKDPLSNVALIKIDTTGLIALKPIADANLKLGSDLFAIGTPADKMLSQTITRGVVSGSRLENDIEFIQTDARLSAGDNGCPLVTSNGSLAGIVNEKILDRGVEGLSFAVPIETVLQRLKIRFQ